MSRRHVGFDDDDEDSDDGMSCADVFCIALEVLLNTAAVVPSAETLQGARIVLVGHTGEAEVELDGGTYAAVAYMRFALVAVGDPIKVRLCCRIDGVKPELLDPPRDITARVVAVKNALYLVGAERLAVTFDVVLEAPVVPAVDAADRAPIVAWDADDVGYEVHADDQTVTRSGRPSAR